MMYEKEFLDSVDKKKFIKLLLLSRDIKPQTAERAFCRIKAHIIKSLNNTQLQKLRNNKIKKPDSAKLLHISQLKESGFHITNEYLIRNYFSTEEIEWLKQTKTI